MFVEEYILNTNDFKNVEKDKNLIIEISQITNYIKDVNFTIITPISVSLRLNLIDNDYLVRGLFETTVKIECSRCLEPFEYYIKEDFYNIYSKDRFYEDEFDLEIQKSDLEISLIEGDYIDIREMLIEQINLQIPIKPLCKENCAGLCSQCGINLNKGKCNCSDLGNNPHFSILQNFFQKS